MIKCFHNVEAILLLVFALSACQKQTATPVITVMEESINLDYRQNSISIGYAVEHANNQELSVYSSQLWVHDFAVTEETVSFVVDMNNSGSYRSASLSLEYPGAVPVTIQVNQGWSPSQIVINPVSNGFGQNGGASSFDYQIENPREGTDLKVKSDCPWIIIVETTNDKISYFVASNNTNSERSGKIILECGSYCSASFVVTQSWSYPRIIITPSSADFDYTGGSGSFNYEVVDPRDGVNITARWSNAIQDVEQKGSTISFTVSANNSAQERRCTIDLDYGSFITSSFFISQKAHPVTSLTLDKTLVSLFVGSEVQLYAQVSPSDAILIWSSSDSTVASVDSNGLVNALKKGNAYIIVETASGSMSASCYVKVDSIEGGNEDIGEIIWK